MGIVRATLQWLSRGAALIVLLGSPSLAVDGVIEINQACAVNTGCTPDDAPGFPITLRSGNYRLTSSLEVEETAAVGIDLLQGGIEIDLNGFSIRGDPVGASQRGIARSASFAPPLITIRNGTIQEFDGGCLFIGDFGRVENMTLTECDVSAISIGENGQVIGNRLRGNLDQDLAMGASTLYRDNQVDELFSAGTVQGGIASGVNVCGGASCSRYPPLRRYYLTASGTFDGDEADEIGVCASGFHFASIWELVDIGSLQYDTSLGISMLGSDSGEGPTNLGGWVRTGAPAFGDPIPGRANCGLWSTSVPGSNGTFAFPSPDRDPLVDSVRRVGVWWLVTRDCGSARQVWCIED